MSDVLVSIVVPTFNSGAFIGDTILSVIHQSYKNWELIIVDGNSTDNTKVLVNDFIKLDSRIRLINNLNDRGPAQARSFGIERCLGEYIAFLDADDLWDSSKLEFQISYMLAHNFLFTYTLYQAMSEDGLIFSSPLHAWPSYSFKSYLCKRGIANSTVILHRSCLSRELLDAYDSGLAEDTLWWLIILKSGIIAYLLPMSLMFYRLARNSRSSNAIQNQIAVWNIYNKHFKINFFYAIACYGFYLIDVIRRKSLATLSTICKKYY